MRNLLAILFCVILPVCVTAAPFAAYDVLGDDTQIEYVQVCEGGVCRLVPVQRAVNLVRNVTDKVVGLDGDGGLQSVLAYDVCGCGCGMSGCNCQGSAGVSGLRMVGQRNTFRVAAARPIGFVRNTATRTRGVIHRAIFHRRR